MDYVFDYKIWKLNKVCYDQFFVRYYDSGRLPLIGQIKLFRQQLSMADEEMLEAIKEELQEIAGIEMISSSTNPTPFPADLAEFDYPMLELPMSPSLIQITETLNVQPN